MYFSRFRNVSRSFPDSNVSPYPIAGTACDQSDFSHVRRNHCITLYVRPAYTSPVPAFASPLTRNFSSPGLSFIHAFGNSATGPRCR